MHQSVFVSGPFWCWRRRRRRWWRTGLRERKGLPWGGGVWTIVDMVLSLFVFLQVYLDFGMCEFSPSLNFAESLSKRLGFDFDERVSIYRISVSRCRRGFNASSLHMEHVLKGTIVSFHMIGRPHQIIFVPFIKKVSAHMVVDADMNMLKFLILSLLLHLHQQLLVDLYFHPLNQHGIKSLGIRIS
ncbi:unnamed protein product, partial [Vitis vinifera]